MSSDAIAELLDAAAEAMLDGDDDRMDEHIAAAVALDPDHLDVRHARARIAFDRGEDETARELLEALVAQTPDDPDPRYTLAMVYSALCEHDKAIHEALEVRRLDAAIEEEEGLVTPELERLVVDAAEEVLAELPEMFASRLSNVAVMITDRPPEDLVREGFDPRAYGLFEGPTDGVLPDVVTTPTRVVLFIGNLVADFGEDEVVVEETRTTVLHEIGHFFGLDEEEVEALGLG